VTPLAETAGSLLEFRRRVGLPFNSRFYDLFIRINTKGSHKYFLTSFQVKKKQFFRNFMTITLFGAVGTMISFFTISLGKLFPKNCL
jgi:hypothetical protein